MNATYECPKCHESVLVKEHETQVKCPFCRALLAVHHNADNINGIWQDLTKLTVIGFSLNS